MKSEENSMSGFFSKGIIEHGLVKKKISFHSDDEYVMYVEIFMCNLLENQLRSYYLDNRIRIDFNLNNFVVKDNILYLVDVMPPIFIDRVVEEKSKRYNRKIAQLIELYTNINYQIISIIGYWFLDCVSDFSRLTEPAVIEIWARALRINSICYFALGMIYVPRAVLNGCGDTGFSMINGITEVACRIGYSNILTRIPAIGYWGIWFTTCATYVTTAIICCIRYFTGKWKDKVIK